MFAIKFHELRCFRTRDERLFALHNTFEERNLELVVKKKGKRYKKNMDKWKTIFKYVG